MRTGRAAADTGMTMGDDDTYSIEELAAAAGMTARNVRAYRTRGLLPEPLRRGRVTRYDDRHLERLLHIRELRQAGIPLRLITEAAGRGTDLGPAGDLWRLTPSPRADPGEHAVDRIGPRSTAPPASVDLRGTSRSPLAARARPAARQPLDTALLGHLDRDARLRRQLTTLGVLSGSGRHCSAEVSLSLRGLAMHGLTPATALEVALHAAEATRGLMIRVNELLTEGGHTMTPALQDLLEALTVGVTREMLAREFDTGALRGGGTPPAPRVL